MMAAMRSRRNRPVEHAQQFLDDDRRQAFGRLIEQQQLRIEHQRAGDGEHLLLAAGELRAEVAPSLGEAREHLEGALDVQAPGRATAVRFSCTVSDLKILRSCGTQPMPAAARFSGFRRVMSRPASACVPPCRRVTPTMVSISVVLPTPLRPSSASERPSPSVNEMPVMTLAAP